MTDVTVALSEGQHSSLVTGAYAEAYEHVVARLQLMHLVWSNRDVQAIVQDFLARHAGSCIGEKHQVINDGSDGLHGRLSTLVMSRAMPPWVADDLASTAEIQLLAGTGAGIGYTIAPESVSLTFEFDPRESRAAVLAKVAQEIDAERAQHATRKLRERPLQRAVLLFFLHRWEGMSVYALDRQAMGGRDRRSEIRRAIDRATRVLSDVTYAAPGVTFQP